MTASTTASPAKHLELKKAPVRHRPWWRIGGETIVVGAIAIASLEAFFNAVGVGQQEFFEPDPVLGTRHIPSKQVTWRLEGLSRDSFNSFGMRDVERQIAKPAGVKRVAILGDSAVEGLQVPLKDIFPRQMEEILNAGARGKTDANGRAVRYEVLNFGCAGYSTAQECVQYDREVARFKPDVVILVYNEGDAAESTLKPEQRLSAEPKPYFYIDERGNLKEDKDIMVLNAHKLAPNPILDWLRRNSRIYGVLSQTNFSLTINEARYVRLKKLIATVEKKLSPSAASIPVPHYPPQTPMKVAERLLVSLAKKVEASGAKFVLIIFPNTLRAPQLFKDAETLKALAQANGFTYMDLTPVFLTHPHMNELFVKVHFSEKGHRLIAEKLAEIVNP